MHRPSRFKAPHLLQGPPHLRVKSRLPAWWGKGEGPKAAAGAVLVNTFLGSHFLHHPTLLHSDARLHCPPPTHTAPQHPFFCGLHNELIVLGVI